ncbi:MAG: hypothetical protein JW730_07950 [Anaerolineales bacterium]|nr:hypothetical protein [Anaerolineales bacterium]
MKSAAKLLVLLVFIFCGQRLTGKAAESAHTLPSARPSHAPGSAVRFEHITVQDGLSQNAALAIFQDRRGFLWIGTQDGLNRYDGYSFTTFKQDADNPASISHNSILSIAEDRDGLLWIGTWGGGLNRFDPATEKFTAYRHIPDDPSSLSNDTVTSILEDSNGVLWVGTLDGLNRFNPQNNGFDHFGNVPDDLTSLSSEVVPNQ